MSAVRPVSVRVEVAPGRSAYDVRIGSGHLAALPAALNRLHLGRTAVLLSNRMVLDRHGEPLIRRLRQGGIPTEVIRVGNSERSKSWSTAGRLLHQLAGLDAPGRKLFLLLAGGGVIGDLGGMVAGLYRRGIPYVQLPTTLLAQVDSSLGGKTGIDLPHGKNLAGLFYQPRLVFIEMDFLRTLSDRQFRSGLAEAIKCGVIRDAQLFSLLERSLPGDLRRDPSVLQQVVRRAVAVKAELVSADERETQGLRTLLNFGHTFGHALETAAAYTRSLTHGEAVALGMRVATDLARRLGLVSAGQQQRINRLLTAAGLPEKAPALRRREVLRAMAHDKKWIQARNRWVLPAGIGRSVIRAGIPEVQVLRSMQTVWEG